MLLSAVSMQAWVACPLLSEGRPCFMPGCTIWGGGQCTAAGWSGWAQLQSPADNFLYHRGPALCKAVAALQSGPAQCKPTTMVHV